MRIAAVLLLLLLTGCARSYLDIPYCVNSVDSRQMEVKGVLLPIFVGCCDECVPGSHAARCGCNKLCPCWKKHNWFVITPEVRAQADANAAAEKAAKGN